MIRIDLSKNQRKRGKEGKRGEERREEEKVREGRGEERDTGIVLVTDWPL